MLNNQIQPQIANKAKMKEKGLIVKGTITRKHGGGYFHVKLDNGKDMYVKLAARFRVQTASGLRRIKSNLFKDDWIINSNF